MKNIRVMLAMIAVLVFVCAISVSGQGPQALPGSGWWTSFQIQNVDPSEQATIVYTAYWIEDSGHDETYEQLGEILIDPNSSVIYNPCLDPNYPSGNRVGFDPDLPDGFAGAVQISADRPVYAVVSVGNNTTGDCPGEAGGKASAFYQGTTGEAVADLISFPVMKHNYYGQTTSFYIQAAGEDATIDATFMSGADTWPITGVSIDAGKTYLLDPAAAGVPDGTLGVLVVEATSGEIAGAVIEHAHAGAPAAFALATRGFGPNDADVKVVAPTNKLDYWGGNTGWQLQNTTAVTATMNVTFTVTGVQPGSDADTAGIAENDEFVVENVSIPPDGSYLFSKGKGTYQEALRTTDDILLASGVFFAGVAVSDQPLVATVNESSGAGKIMYAAFGANNATTKIALPLVKEMFYGQTTATTVQNVGTAPTDVTLTYVGNKGTFDVGPYTLGPGKAMNFFKLCDDTRWSTLYGVGDQPECEANNAVSIVSTAEPIVAVAQESSLTTGALDVKNYEGFNLE